MCSILFLLTISSCTNLKNDEIAKLRHNYSGCFGSENNTITIYRQNDQTFAKLETNGKTVRNIKLSIKEIAAFNSFTKTLTNLKETQGCSNVEEYILYTKDRTIKRTDGSCGWHGFNSVKKAVFNISD